MCPIKIFINIETYNFINERKSAPCKIQFLIINKCIYIFYRNFLNVIFYNCIYNLLHICDTSIYVITIIQIMKENSEYA